MLDLSFLSYCAFLWLTAVPTAKAQARNRSRFAPPLFGAVFPNLVLDAGLIRSGQRPGAPSSVQALEQLSSSGLGFCGGTGQGVDEGLNLPLGWRRQSLKLGDQCLGCHAGTKLLV
jgi:hypothetical protein